MTAPATRTNDDHIRFRLGNAQPALDAFGHRLGLARGEAARLGLLRFLSGDTLDVATRRSSHHAKNLVNTANAHAERAARSRAQFDAARAAHDAAYRAPGAPDAPRLAHMVHALGAEYEARLAAYHEALTDFADYLHEPLHHLAHATEEEQSP